MRIEDIDTNFAAEKFNLTDVVFYDVKQSPFKVYGVFHDGDCFRRVPARLAEEISENIVYLAKNTSGGRVRFKTNSPYIIVKCVTGEEIDLSTYMSRTGFTVYADGKLGGLILAPTAEEIKPNGGYSGIVRFPDCSPREITVCMPLYHSVRELYIGVEKSSLVSMGAEYSHTKPLLFYGSSITQGSCASRPGNSYVDMLSQMLDSDYINLGFSGNCRAEPIMADYIAGLDCSVFICDYDYNTPNVEYLKATHYPLYERFRKTHRDTPVVFMSKPDYKVGYKEDKERRKIIKSTYEMATAAGDKNVYFVDGAKLLGTKNRDRCLVDGIHPNDLGFERIARRVYKVLYPLLNKILNK